MCTVTVLHRQHAIIISMNRDEQRARLAEQPPSLWPNSTLTAPQDAAAGGTWMGVNAQGHWACILNSYVPYTPPQAPPSRGSIIPMLLASDDPRTALMTLACEPYRPFRIMLGTPSGWELFHWNGQTLSPEAKSDGHDFMISSSSWNIEAVLNARHAAFAAWQAQGSRYDDAGIATIHRWQEAGFEREGILMARPETHTTSLTQIVLGAQAVPSMHYWPAEVLTPISLGLNLESPDNPN